MKAKIICVGNRLMSEDALGPLVYDSLCRTGMPVDVEVVDGGLQGLNLLGAVDGADRVVFVDSLVGFAGPGQVVVLSPDRATSSARGAYGHAAGLGYLLRALPIACDSPPSSVAVVGAEGEPDEGLVGAVAARALELASGGTP